MVAHSIRDAQDFKNPRVMAARKELVRLINLAHILVCISGDGANHVFAQRPIVKCAPLHTATLAVPPAPQQPPPQPQPHSRQRTSHAKPRILLYWVVDIAYVAAP